MIITWHGNHTVKIVTKAATLVLDPHSPEAGPSPFRSKSDIVALTNPSSDKMSYLKAIQGDPEIINTPGEYSVKDMTLYAKSWHDKEGKERSIHRWNIENMFILHLGAMNRSLTDEELQEIEQMDIDILLLPIGGKDGLNTKQALEILTKVEPRLVIPINYKVPKIKEDLESVDQFAKEMGVNPKSKESKLNINAKKLPSEGLVTTILSA